MTQPLYRDPFSPQRLERPTYRPAVAPRRTPDATQVLFRDSLNQSIKPDLKLPPARRSKSRRLSSIVRQHVGDLGGRPYFVSVVREGDELRPSRKTTRLRAQWNSTLVGPGDKVLVVAIGEGGGGQAKQAIGAIAMIGLALAAPWAAGAIAGSIGGSFGAFLATETGLTLLKTGIVVGGAMVYSALSQPKANEARKVFSVSGGGNVPRYGDRVQCAFGNSWITPDLSQADWFHYDGQAMLLYKRMTVSVGDGEVLKIRNGATTLLWTKEAGILPPFNSVKSSTGTALGTAVEFLSPGEFSTLVPGNVYSAQDVGGSEIGRSNGSVDWTGPFAAMAADKPSTRIQLDFSFPSGIQETDSGGTDSATGRAFFQYAPCDEDNLPTGPYVTLLNFTKTTETTQNLRFTRYVDVPEGRYVVRSRNPNVLDSDVQDQVNWDGLRSHYPEQIARQNFEVCMRIRAGKTVASSNFSNVQVQFQRHLRVWDADTETFSVQATNKAVWAYLEMLTADYGGNVSDDEIDLSELASRAETLTEYDEFNGTIRGPTKLWEAMVSVLGVMRAEPTRYGGLWSLQRDEARLVPEHMVTQNEIERDSTSLEYDIDITSAQAASDVILEYYEDGDGGKLRQTRCSLPAETPNPTIIRIPGVTKDEHAEMLAKWFAAAAYHRRIRLFGSTDVGGRLWKRGDTARIPVMFLKPESITAQVIYRDGLELWLQTAIDVQPGDYIEFRDRKGRRWGQPIAVTQGTSPSSVLLDATDLAFVEGATSVDLDDVLTNDDYELSSVVVGPLDDQTYIFRAIEPDDNDRIRFEAVVNAPEVWDKLGETPVPPIPVPSKGDAEPIQYAQLGWVKGRCVQKASNLVMEWSIGGARGADSIRVELSYDDWDTEEVVYEGALQLSGSYPIKNTPGVTVKIRAYGIKDGIEGPEVEDFFDTILVALNSNISTVTADSVLGEFIASQIADGAIIASKIAANAVEYTKLAADLNPPQNFVSLPNPVGYTGSEYVIVSGRLYQYVGGAWVDAVSGPNITGTLPAGQVGNGLTSTQIASVNAAVVSGALVAATLEANKVTVASGGLTNAQIASLEAAKITVVGGGLTDAQIAGVSAAKLTTQIQTTNIANNAITTPLILAGAVKTAQIDAGAITAEKMTIGAQTDNLLINGGFESGLERWTVYQVGGGTVTAVSGAAYEGGLGLRLNRATATPGTAYCGAAQNVIDVQVTAGSVYEFAYWVKSASGVLSASSVSLLAILEWYTSAGAFVSNSVLASDVPAAWTQKRAQFTCPATATLARVVFQHDIPSTVAIAWVDGITVRRSIGATVIEDGAITTNKIFALSVTAAKIGAGEIVTSKLAVGFGGNMLGNSDFVGGIGAIPLATNTTGLTPVLALGNAPTDSPRGMQSVKLTHTGGTPANATYQDWYFYRQSPGAPLQSSGFFPVTPGEKYEFSLYGGASGGANITGYIAWVDAAGFTVGYSQLSTITTMHAAETPLTQWARAGIIAAALPTATRCFFLIRTSYTGAASPASVVTGMFFAKALANQTELTDWSPAGSTSIIGDQIVTGSLNANRIVANSITAGQILAGTITATEIGAGQVTAAKAAFGQGNNRLEDSVFASGTVTSIINYDGGTGLPFYAQAAGPGTIDAPSNTRSFLFYPLGTPGAGTYTIHLLQQRNSAGTPSDHPVDANKRYEFSFYLSTLACSIDIRIQWINAAGAGVGSLFGSAVSGAPGANVSMAAWPRIGIFGTAPPTAVAAQLHFVTTYAGGQLNAGFRATGFVFAEAFASQTEFSAWSPAGVTTIDGGVIRTATLNADRLVANSITAGQISAGAIGATQIAADAVRAIHILAGEVATSKLAVTGWNNLIGNSDLSKSDTLTTTVNALSLNTGSLYLDTNSGWGPPDLGTVFWNSPGSPTGYAYFELRNPVPGGTYFAVPVKSGMYYEFSFYSSQHRVQWTQAQIDWLDGAGAYISSSTGASKSGPYQTQGPLDGQPRCGVMAQAPGTAYYARLVCIVNANTQATPYCFFFAPFFGGLSAAQFSAGQFTPFTKTGTTLISGGQIITNAITANHITAGSITASKISVSSLAAITVTTGSLNVTGVLTVGTYIDIDGPNGRILIRD